VLSSRPEYFDAQAPLGVASGLALSGAAGQVGASVGIDAQARTSRMVCNARLSWRSPPRLIP
jgi:hypothetical protein